MFYKSAPSWTVAYCRAEGVYSWRTGGSAKGDINGPFGVRMPDSRGSLLHQIQDRQRFYQELDDTLRENLGSSSSARYSRTDTGHPFASAKWQSVPVMVQAYDRVSPSQPWTPGNLFPLHAEAFAVAPSWGRDFGFGFQPKSQYWDPYAAISLSSVKKVTQDQFASMAPQRPIASIGETVVDLIRGNVPRMVSHIARAIEREKGLHKALGSDYLAAQFGWMPIISDIRNVINVLTSIDRMTFAESTRRSRQWMSFSGSYAGRRTPLASLSYHNGTGGGASFSTNASADIDSLAFMDHKLSSRFVAVARPTRAANYFVDKAADAIQNLGLWTPSLGWDLLPWSWLVDWSVALGSGLTNATYYGSQPGQYNIDYAYITTVSRLNTRVSNIKPLAPTKYYRTEMSGGTALASSIWKERQRASPYGLWVDLTGLSASQFAILVALGLAHS